VKKNTMGERIAIKTLEKGLTQGELARQTDSSAAAVSQWIGGKKLPTRDNVRALAKVLEVNSQWLEFGTGLESMLAAV
jgi:transcriptional regulator with XRE-family HTH domain